MEDIDKLIEELTDERKVMVTKSLVMGYLKEKYGYAELTDIQESVLNHILYNDENHIIIKSRQTGMTKLSEALFYAKKEMGN